MTALTLIIWTPLGHKRRHHIRPLRDYLRKGFKQGGFIRRIEHTIHTIAASGHRVLARSPSMGTSMASIVAISRGELRPDRIPNHGITEITGVIG